jgi:protein-tyrosine phosphatase
MIDLHCHYLPGLDDGAQTLDDALALAQAAVADGIAVAVMTPHVRPGVYDNRLSGIAEQVERFRSELAAHAIPLRIRAGGEVHLTAEVMELAEQDELPCIGSLDGYRVALIEMPHGHIPLGADRLMHWLLRRRIRPMIAHPERNKEVMRAPEKIYPLVALGCLLQVTAASLTGRFGAPAQRCAEQLLQQRWVSAVASDAHSLAFRPPEMRAARALLAARHGAAMAERLTRTLPASIVGDNS